MLCTSVFTMFRAVAFVFVLQSTGSILCEQTVSGDTGFHESSKLSANALC